MPRIRMAYSFSIVCWLSIVLVVALLNHRRIGLRRGIEVVSAADVVVLHGSLYGRIARQRQMVELVLEDRLHALEVVSASSQGPPGGRFHTLGGIGCRQPQNPQTRSISHLWMALGPQNRFHQLPCIRSNLLGIFNQQRRRASYMLLVRLRHVIGQR